jgi:imidazolonepropionase-like amidohydrolase
MIEVFRNVSLLDGTVNMKMQRNMTVAVENGTVISVSKRDIQKGRCREIDLKGRTLLPGLVNLHCHLAGNGKPQKIGSNTADLIQSQLKSPVGRFIMKKMCLASAKTELMSGTTTVRTVGGLGSIDAQIRDDIARGKNIGPRLVVANEAISVPGGHMAGTLAYISHSEDEAISLVRQIAEGKPDLIKLMITGGTLDIKKIGEEEKVLMPPSMVRCAVNEAHRLGYKVAAHVQGCEGIRVALENGVDTIEHGGDIDVKMIELFRQTGSALISTITVVAAMACLPVEMSNLPPLYRESCRNLLSECISGFKKAVKAGIPIGLGMDNGSPLITQYSTWRELYFFTRYIGTEPSYALHAATLGGAEILGLSNVIGSVEEGKKADFLIVDGNPLEDFSCLSSPWMVVKDGKIFASPRFLRYGQYDALLDKVSEYDSDFIAK